MMCGPRSPCLLPLLPRQAHPTPHPRTRQQAQVSSGHRLKFNRTLPPDPTTPSSAHSPMHWSQSGTPCHHLLYTNSPIVAISRALKPQITAIYGRKTDFGPCKLKSNTFSACLSPHWWQLTFIFCLLFYLSMRSSPPSLPYFFGLLDM